VRRISKVASPAQRDAWICAADLLAMICSMTPTMERNGLTWEDIGGGAVRYGHARAIATDAVLEVRRRMGVEAWAGGWRPVYAEAEAMLRCEAGRFAP
jgi:hypothetical protein